MANVIKPDGQDGRFTFFSYGTALTSASEAYTGGFAKITAKGAASAFDAMKDDTIEGGKALEVGDVVHLPAWEAALENPLSEGDECDPIEMDIEGASWVTDKSRSFSRDLQDRTSQGDVIKGERDYHEGSLQNETGSISGLYALGSDVQREIDSHFIHRIVDKSGKKTKVPIKSGAFDTAFCYRETTAAGEVEIWLFRSMYIQSVDDAGSPQAGNVPFNFSYTVAKKTQYERTIPAA